jgi:hypothetical protein
MQISKTAFTSEMGLRRFITYLKLNWYHQSEIDVGLEHFPSAPGRTIIQDTGIISTLFEIFYLPPLTPINESEMEWPKSDPSRYRNGP